MKTIPKKFTPLLAALACGLTAPWTVAASNDTWVGNTDANWSTAANWTFSSGSAVNPSGDYLIFGVAGTSGALLNNDLSAYSFAGLTFNTGATAFTFSGNAFSLAGGITNNATAVPVINNNLTLAGNQTISAATGNITLGGVVSDGGSGYGLTFPAAHNVTLAGVNTYSGSTTNFGGGTLTFSGAGSIPNSSLVLGKTGSTAGAYLTIAANTQAAGTITMASGLTVNAGIIGGNNFASFNANGSSLGNVTDQFGPLALNSGVFRVLLTPNSAANLAFNFNSFSRSPGTALSFDRGTAPGANPIANQTANSANVVFATPPALLGSGTVGTTTAGIVPGVSIGTGPATYDTTYGLRGLNGTTEQIVLASGLAAPGQNTRATAATTISAATEVNSLAMQGSFTIALGGNTLTVDSGWVGSTVNGVIGSAANDGFLALGAEGFFDVANARSLTVNSVITGNNGLTINLDDLNNTAGAVVMTAANTYSGVTRVLANASLTLKLNNSLALQNSTLDYNNYGGTITFNGPTSFTFGGLKGAQNLAIAVPLTLGGDGDSTTYSGILSGAGSLIKNGSGAFTLTGANTFSGGTTISSGQVNLNFGGSSSANSSIGVGALTIAGGSIDNTSGSAVTLAPNNAQNWNGDFTFVGSANLNLGTGLVALNSNRRVTVNANTLTVGGAISGTGFSLTKNGNGTLALAGANTYSGNTAVAGGTLALTGSASVGSSPSIIVSNGATLDVSGLSSTFTLGGSQSLYGSGTNNGSVTTTSGSQVYSDAGVAYGTNTFNNNLTLVSGATANFQLGAAASGANDLIAVGGNLVLNGNTINISAPSTSANLATADYTLFTAAGGISGSAAVTPNWVVKPLNFANYTIVTSGNTVKLHYASISNPVGIGSASPNPAGRTQNITVPVTVTTPGSSPVSTVTVNATPIGGSASVALVQVGATAVYTNTLSVGAGVSAGSTPLTANINDTDGGSASVTVPLTILAGTVTWNGASGSGNNWSDTANWIGGISPLGGDVALFAGTTRLTPLMNNSFSLSSLTFNATAGSFLITNTTGSVLTLTGNGITNNSANAQALNVPVVMNSAQTFNTAAGNLALAGTVSGSSLTKVGNNALTLAGANNYGGGTTVGAGTVVVANNSALGSGVLTLGGGSVSNAAGTSYSVPNNVTVSSPANVGVGAGDTFTLSGTVSGGAVLTKAGNGLLVLPSANNTSGGLTVSGGTLVVANNSAVGTGMLTVGNASVSDSAGNSYTVGNGVDLSGSASVIVGTNDSFTLSGVITDAGSLTKVSNGTLIIGGSAANTYSGGTILNAGFLDVENTGLSPLGSGPLVFAGGTLENNSASAITISNNITVVSNTTTALNPTGFNGNGLVLAGNISGPGNIVVNGNATTFDSFVLTGSNSAFSGTLTVNSGADQRFAFGSTNAGSPNAAFVLNSPGVDNQKLAFGNGTIAFGSLSGAGQMRNDGGASLSTLRIGDLNTSTAFTGLLVANGTAQIGILKVGTGILSMTNANTYNGPTEIAGGEFDISVVQGSGTAYQVDDGATLGIVNYTGSGRYAQPLSLTCGTNTGASLLFTNVDANSGVGLYVLANFTNNGTCTVVITDTNNLVVGTTYPLILWGSYSSSGTGGFVLSSSRVQGYVTNDLSQQELELFVTGFSTVATNPTNLTAVVTGNSLSLTWPGDHLGWYLQAQTNSLSNGLGKNWVDVPGSSSVTNLVMPINPANPSVFYRMSLNP